MNGLGFNTALGLLNGLPILERIVFHITNCIGQKETFYLRVQGPEAKRLVLFLGLVKWETGRMFKMKVRCTAAAFPVLVRGLLRRSFILQSQLILKPHEQ